MENTNILSLNTEMCGALHVTVPLNDPKLGMGKKNKHMIKNNCIMINQNRFKQS